MIRSLIAKLFDLHLPEEQPALPQIRRLSDEALYEAFLIDLEHPVNLAWREIAMRAAADAKDQARGCMGTHAEVTYYLGAEWSAEQLLEYAESVRQQARNRQLKDDY